jgi:hypothetical protein
VVALAFIRDQREFAQPLECPVTGIAYAMQTCCYFHIQERS